MKEAILNLSTAIRTPVLPEIKDTIKHIPIDYDGVVKYSTNICEWLNPVIDLSNYHVYPRNGITEGLDTWTQVIINGLVPEVTCTMKV